MKQTIKKALILLLMVFFIGAGFYFFKHFANKPGASWHVINVNSGKLQGDANLIIVGDETIMIDAGYVSEAKISVIPYLNKLGVKHIDHFFISHPHRDHYEGLAPILGSGISIGKMYYKVPAPEIKDCCYNKAHFLKFINFAKDHGVELIEPGTGFRLPLADNSFIEILHAQEGNLPHENIDVNDLSLIMRWKIYGTSVLFPGDLNTKLGRVLSSDPRMHSDFLKAPHHGAASLAPVSFFDAVDPQAMVVPAPEGIWCSKRGLQAREWSKARNIPTWVNGINGHIKVEFKDDETLITPERTNGKCKSRKFGRMIFRRSEDLQNQLRQQ